MMVRTLIVVCFLLSASSSVLAPESMAQRRLDDRATPRPIPVKEPRVVLDLFSFKAASASPTMLSTMLPRPDSTRMDLYVAVPYSSLEFLFAVDKYVADYAVSVQVTGNDASASSTRRGELPAMRLLVDRYETYTVLESTSQHHDRVGRDEERADAEQISFLMVPGRNYELRLGIRDLSSRHEFDTSIAFSVKDFANVGPAMSDLMVYRDRHEMRVVPSIGPDVSLLVHTRDAPRISPSASSTMLPTMDHASTMLHASSGVFAEVYNLPADSTLGVVTEVLHVGDAPRMTDHATTMSPVTESVAMRTASTLRTSPTNQASMTDHASSTIPGASPTMLSIPETPLFAPITFDEIWTGRYELRTYILPSFLDTDLEDPAALEKRALVWAKRNIIVSVARGIPISVGDLDQAIEQLRLIATGSEWDSLNDAHTAKEKRTAILDFWSKKNPASHSSLRSVDDANRPMEVFYSRVEYSNSHFATGFQAGWKTDRGRVYIPLGPPDFIDSHSSMTDHAYEAMQMPYELWEYSSPHSSPTMTRYTFVDRYTLGDYRLTGAPPPPGTFVWEASRMTDHAPTMH